MKNKERILSELLRGKKTTGQLCKTMGYMKGKTPNYCIIQNDLKTLYNQKLLAKRKENETGGRPGTSWRIKTDKPTLLDLWDNYPQLRKEILDHPVFKNNLTKFLAVEAAVKLKVKIKLRQTPKGTDIKVNVAKLVEIIDKVKDKIFNTDHAKEYDNPLDYYFYVLALSRMNAEGIRFYDSLNPTKKKEYRKFYQLIPESFKNSPEPEEDKEIFELFRNMDNETGLMLSQLIPNHLFMLAMTMELTTMNQVIMLINLEKEGKIKIL